ncbi:MAG: hypothetical protein KatS3mg115_2664 [Candidatus Poribacteria bacterium]|nr:MAG: hypothetical protein KatS3mg115_2664 [Candidatus Poribacteria bacterium]
MSRVRNANEFLLRFRELSGNYERLFAPRIAEVRRRYAGSPQKDLLDQSLEAHVRAYIVNAFLAALNWRLDARPEDGLPNVIPEVPVRSHGGGTIRFFDYLALEKQTNNPLLIVETKRSSAELPQARSPAASPSEIVSRGLAGEKLMGEWGTWLDNLRDYVRSASEQTGKAPRRAVATNGDWLILFLDPRDAFLKEGSHDPNRILVFTDRNDIERRFTELFRDLEHQHVLKETPTLVPGELSFYVDPGAVDRAMHGLQLRYIEQPGVYRPAPVIKVAPVVFLRSRYGAWLRVEAPPQDYELPHKSSDLAGHLADVGKAAKDLLCSVNHALGTSLHPFPLSKHYGDEDGFAAIRGVVEHDRDQFLMVTGDRTHYLLPTPSVPGCPYHDWTACNSAGVPSNPGPITVRSVSLRAFFISGELHHCAHRDVGAAKASPITAQNQGRCGPRSGNEGEAFCEIWRFEQHLCCRTCAFEEVCTKAAVFRLPCQRPGNHNRAETTGPPVELHYVRC